MELDTLSFTVEYLSSYPHAILLSDLGKQNHNGPSTGFTHLFLCNPQTDEIRSLKGVRCIAVVDTVGTASAPTHSSSAPRTTAGPSSPQAHHMHQLQQDLESILSVSNARTLLFSSELDFFQCSETLRYDIQGIADFIEVPSEDKDRTTRSASVRQEENEQEDEEERQQGDEADLPDPWEAVGERLVSWIGGELPNLLHSAMMGHSSYQCVVFLERVAVPPSERMLTERADDDEHPLTELWVQRLPLPSLIDLAEGGLPQWWARRKEEETKRRQDFSDHLKHIRGGNKSSNTNESGATAAATAGGVISKATVPPPVLSTSHLSAVQHPSRRRGPSKSAAECHLLWEVHQAWYRYLIGAADTTAAAQSGASSAAAVAPSSTAGSEKVATTAAAVPPVPLPTGKDLFVPPQRRVDAFLRHVVHVRRQRLALKDSATITAGNSLVNEVRRSNVVRIMETWLKDRVDRLLGRVGNLVGAKMAVNPRWLLEDHPHFGEEMRRAHFSFDANVVVLDSFLCPVVPNPVLRAQQEWRRLVQIDPVLFRFRTLPVELSTAASKLSKKLVCSPSDLAFVLGLDQTYLTVLQSLPWLPGDTLLLVDPPTDGRLSRLASLLTLYRGVRVMQVRLSEMIAGKPEDVEQRFDALLSQLRPLACVMPVMDPATLQALPVVQLVGCCSRRHAISIVDGGTSFGNTRWGGLTEINCDVFLTQLDVFMFAPVGVCALVVRPNLRRVITTLVVSYSYGKGFDAEWQYSGLSDCSGILAVHQALQFRKFLCFGSKEYCHALADEATEFLCAVWGVRSFFGNGSGLRPSSLSPRPANSITLVPCPRSSGRSSTDAALLQRLLAEAFQVHVSILVVRVSWFVAEGGTVTGEYFLGEAFDEYDPPPTDGNDSLLAVRITANVYTALRDIKSLAGGLIHCITNLCW